MPFQSALGRLPELVAVTDLWVTTTPQGDQLNFVWSYTPIDTELSAMCGFDPSLMGHPLTCARSAAAERPAVLGSAHVKGAVGLATMRAEYELDDHEPLGATLFEQLMFKTSQLLNEKPPPIAAYLNSVCPFGAYYEAAALHISHVRWEEGLLFGDGEAAVQLYVVPQVAALVSEATRVAVPILSPVTKPAGTTREQQLDELRKAAVKYDIDDIDEKEGSIHRTLGHLIQFLLMALPWSIRHAVHQHSVLQEEIKLDGEK
jgi:hypothetical protein